MAKQQPWIQAGNRWEQDLGCMTKFYASIAPPEGQVMHWMVASAVDYRYHGPNIEMEETLRTAWVELRYKFPALGAQVVDMKKIYETPDDTVLAAWLASSFRVHQDETVEGVFQGLCNTPYITLHYFPSSSQLLIAGAHTYLDGRGALYLFDALFSTIANPGNFKFGDEHSRLSLTEDTLLGLPPVLSEADHERAGMALGQLQQDKPIRMPVANVQQTPKGSARQELKLSTSTSDAVIKACKQRGYTVTSAWHTAIVFAVSQIQAASREDGTTYTSFTNYDLRQYFPASFEPRSQPVSCYHGAVPLRIELGSKSFDEVSAAIKKSYMAEFQPNNIGTLPAMAGMLPPAFAKGPPPSSTPVLSSLGVVDQFLSHSFGPHWEVENIWVADTMLSAEIEAFLWTWKGQIVLSGSFNSAYYTNAEVRAFLERVEGEMIRGLGVTVAP
jgi:hypothetical protein